ncbi:hypothetical protein [Mesorhizobium sp. 1B3]|uniref:hypothetical protein n=1 Tax=Mesorhizobium sp. 1B3 TaxID=3243599 RepID=UPI003D96B11D
MVSRAIALFGTDQDTPSMRTLRAGPLSVEFDNGALRYIRLDGTEVLRAIAFLVRDENWGTFSPEIENLEIEEGADGFAVTYRATCSDAERTLSYDATITGAVDGSLSFEAVAEPQTDVLTNRTGFIVLHPVEGVAGRPVKILHVDGREETAIFPELIDPRCPFKDIRSLSHEIAPGVWATCRMEGDAFEMEDQRNWSDASYKTYVRPLTKPWPYVLCKGEKIAQSVSLTVSGILPVTSGGAADRPVSLTLGAEAGRFPAIGLGVPAEEASFALEKGDLLKRLEVASLICEIDLRKGHGRAQMEHYRALADLTGAEITLEIVTKGTLDPLGELVPVARAAQEARLRPQTITVFPAQDMVSVQPDAPWPEMPTFEETYAAARKAFPEVRLGGGMATYFTELNRKRPPAASLDFVTHTTCPNVHAADDQSVMETNEALPYQILSTRSFMGDMPYRIGPSQLACRENPYGRSTTPNPDNSRLCLSAIDPRQRGIFNAAWMIAYVAACARGGVEAVAFGSPTGPMGHIHRTMDFRQPYFDDRPEAVIYPGFHVIAGLARLSGQPLLEVNLSPRSKIEAIAADEDGRPVLWLANLTGRTVEVALPDQFRSDANMAVLDADSFENIAARPNYLDISAQSIRSATVALDAYAVARIRRN